MACRVASTDRAGLPANRRRLQHFGTHACSARGLPTGAGKSLTYQLPARLLGGVTLVVSPLIALMRDQVEALRQAGVASKPARVAKRGKGTSAQRTRGKSPPLPLDEAGLARFEALKAWRGELARIFHEPMLGEVKRLQVLRGAIFGLPLRRFEAICEFCRHRPQTPG